MEQNTFLQVLKLCDLRINKLKTQLQKTSDLYKHGMRETAYEEALKMTETAEQLALLARQLPAYTGNPNAQNDVNIILKETVPVSIEFTEQGWFVLKIPCLLPKKEKGHSEYIRGFLYPAMQEYFENKDPVRFSDCVLIYRHIYDKRRPERMRRDHDNFEINFVTDAVAFYVMHDDCPSECKHFYCSDEGDEDSTEVYVVPNSEFIEWLDELGILS